MAGGFPRDTDRADMEEALRPLLAQVRGLADIKAKYNKGSVALLRFTSSSLMWNMMRSKPSIRFGVKEVWFSLPKSSEERSRDTALGTTRRVLEGHSAEASVTISWQEGLVSVGGSPVAKFDMDTMKMVFSASQLTHAGITKTAEEVSAEIAALLRGTPAGASNVSDWQ